MRVIPLILISLTLAMAARAQSPMADQLEIFGNLTPEEKQAVLQQLATQQGGGMGSAGEKVAGSPTRAPDADSERRRGAEVKEAPAIPVAGPEDTLLVEAALIDAPSGQMDSKERTRLEELATLIRSRNPYRLDREGRLNLPGFAPIVLNGLTEVQALRRLTAEPALAGLELKLARLPVVRTGVEGLKPYGYELFDNAPSTFSPVTDVPLPDDYIVGPGDEFNVQLSGSVNRSQRLTVSRDNTIGLMELGQIRVGGLTFNEARRLIQSNVKQRMIGVQADIAMGDTRTIRIFVSGQARQIGSYVVSGLATMTTALYASGGVKPIGSLRNIQLKRQGKVVRRLDLYDFLIHGDLSDDARLQSGDVIFIPPVGSTISVDGEVKQPAIYELLDEANLADVVQIAGGITSEADVGRASLTRIDSSSRRVVLNVNLAQAAETGLPRNGDVLRVARLRPQLDAGVVLEGFVYRPGLFAWREGLRLTDVISSVDELRPGADQHYVLIRRESGSDLRISSLQPDLAQALAAPGSAADVLLQSRDRIIVFDQSSSRERIIEPLMAEMRQQSALDLPTEVVLVSGRVKLPGEYPLDPGMRIADLLRAGGGLSPSAFGGTAELARYSVDSSGTRQTELIVVDLAAMRRGDAGANLQLRPFDRLLVKETPDWQEHESIVLRGEVRFPGTYPIRKGETLREVLDRAGGVTALAFPEGGAFTRSDLKAIEQEQLDRLGQRMRTELLAISLQAANAGKTSAAETLQEGQSQLAQLQNAEATGRFIIDLPGLLAQPAHSDNDVVLRNGDELFVPKRRQEVTVIGEVQNATSHLFLPGLKRSEYIAMSGGMTRKADKGRIYVVRADGRTATRAGSRLERTHDIAIKPGDTIVVPLDTERMPRLPLWQAVTQILYNLAVSVAAVNSF